MHPMGQADVAAQPPSRVEVIAMSETILLLELACFLLMLLMAFKRQR